MTSTKMASLEAHTGSGAKVAQQEAIMSFLSIPWQYSRNEIALYLHMRLSSVCARVNELLEDGRLVRGEKVTDPITLRTVQTVKLAPELACG